LLHGSLGFAQVKMGHGSAIGRLERLGRGLVAPQEEIANAQPHRRGRGAVFAHFQFGHGVAEHAILRKVLGNRVHQPLNFLGTKRPVGQHDLLEVGLDSL